MVSVKTHYEIIATGYERLKHSLMVNLSPMPCLQPSSWIFAQRGSRQQRLVKRLQLSNGYPPPLQAWTGEESQVGYCSPLFRRIRRGDHIQTTRFTACGARNAIQLWANIAGVEEFISGHSLGGGTAVSLAKTGASVVAM